MIKIEYEINAKSYWRNDELYDYMRDERKSVRIFGIKIYERQEMVVRTLADNDNKKVGFKN